jgi:hypothetical protein
MPNSKYPNQIDTNSELPVVRGNLDEIGPDAINSLRSAIIQIEKVLGINPQGAIGSTVGSRLSKSIDQSGNLLREALERANVLFGQITNDNIAKDASIDEQKLKLNIPTSVLQSEISYISGLIDTMVSQIRELSSLYSAHVSTSASNRHPSSAISHPATTGSSITSFKGNDATSSVSDVLTDIIESHINFNGETTADNNSHLAEQIYFDNQSYPDVITSSNVQGAIDNLAGSANLFLIDYKNLNNSNGLVRKANFVDSSVGSNFGILIAESVSISIAENISTNKITQVIFDVSISAPDFPIKKNDFIHISTLTISSEFQIYDVEYDPSDSSLISSIYVFGNFSSNISSDNANVYYKRKDLFQSGSLLIGGIYDTSLTSSNTISVSNPSSAMIISSGLKPYEISDTNKFLNISINDNDPIIINLFPDITQTLSVDYLVQKINEEFNANLMPLSAYRIDLEDGGTELVIGANVGSDLDYNAGIKVSRGSDDAIDSLGLSQFEDKIVYGKLGTFYEINGSKFYDLNKKLLTKNILFSTGSNSLSYSEAAQTSFKDLGINVGDFISILGDGFNYFLRISSVSDTELQISNDQLPLGFTKDSEEGLLFIIYGNTLNFSSFNFESVSDTFGSAILEIFLDKENKLFYNPIMELETPIIASEAILNLIDFENPSNESSAILYYRNNVDNKPEVSIDDEVYTTIIGDGNEVELLSNITGLKVTIVANDSIALYNRIAGGLTSSDIFFFAPISDISNLLIGNVCFNYFNSTITGGINGFRPKNKLKLGTISSENISNEFVSKNIDLKINDLRSDGVVSGLEVYMAEGELDGYSDAGFFQFSVKAGVAYVSGKRFFIEREENIITNILVGSSGSDKIYIGIDDSGNIIFESCDIDCNYPWDDKKVCLLASLEYSSLVEIIDMRLFINELDLKIINAITVSPKPGLAHFTDFVKAIKYAKRFSQIFPGAGTPEIILKSGNHEVTVDVTTDSTFVTFFAAITSQSISEYQVSFFDEHIKNGVFIDFPVKISGEGTNSKLILRTKHINSNDSVETIFGGYFIISGYGFNLAGNRTSLYHSRLRLGDFDLNDLSITSDLSSSDINEWTSNVLILDHFSLENNQIKIKNCSIDEIFFAEVSEILSLKGNLFIDNCLIKWKITFTPSTRWINVAASNNTFLNEYFSISNLVYEDLDQYDPSKKITFFNNINYYRGSASADRDYDRTSNNLVVGGSLEVYEDLTVGDEIIFKTDKTMTKEIWIYKEMINSLLHKESISSYTGAFSPSTKYIYDKSEANYAAREPFMDLAASSSLDDVEERVKILDIDYDSGTRNRYMPAVIVYGSSSSLAGSKLNFIIPVSDGQRISTINIYPGYPETLALSTDLIQMSIYKISHRGVTGYDAPILVAESLNLQLLGGGASANKKFSWDVETLESGEPTLLVDTSEWSYLLEVSNVYSSDIYLTRAVLKFKSKKLFELIGLK